MNGSIVVRRTHREIDMIEPTRIGETELPPICHSADECAKVLGCVSRTFWRWLKSDSELAAIVQVRKEFSDVRTGSRRLIEADTIALLLWKQDRKVTYGQSRNRSRVTEIFGSGDRS